MAPTSDTGTAEKKYPGRLRRWLRIRPSESRTVLGMGILALCFGTFSAIYFAGGTAALVVAAKPKTFGWLLPLLYVAAGLAAFAGRWSFSVAEGRHALRPLSFLALGLALSLELLLAGALTWFGHGIPLLWVASAWFISIAPALCVMDLLFWGLAVRLFDVARVQRLSGLLTGLAVSAGTFGFFIVIVLAFLADQVLDWKWTDSSLLLLAVAGAMLLLALLPLWKLTVNPAVAQPKTKTRVDSVSTGAAIRPLRDRYILFLTGLTLLLVLTHYLLDVGFLTIFNTEYRGKAKNFAETAAFISAVMFLTKVAELVFRCFLARWLSRRFGPEYGLKALPLALIACLALAFVMQPVGNWNKGAWVPIILFLKGFEILLRAPAFEPSLSVLFLTLPAGVERAVRRLIAERVRPLVVVLSSTILLFLGLLPSWGPAPWLWALVPVLASLLGLSLLGRRLYRRRVLAAFVQRSSGAAQDARSEVSVELQPQEDSDLAIKVLPLYMAEFPGEYKGTSAAKRREAFARLLDLPDRGLLRPVREAAARRSTRELKHLAARSFLARAQAAVIACNAPSDFAPTGVASGDHAEFGPASLTLLQGLGLVLPESSGSEPEGKAAKGPAQDGSSAETVAAQPGEPAAGVMVQAHDSANPFPGLRPFEPEEARLFFGRGVHTRELLRKLSRNRFLAVVGTSGSGKSSLVRAGLIPALREGALIGTASCWRVAVLRPGGDPIGELALALTAPSALGGNARPMSDESGNLQTTLTEVTLRRSALGLADAVRQARLPADEHLLVVVDQFEEVFRFKRETEGRRGSEDAAAFVKLLLEGSRAMDVPVYVVLTMRSDYLGDCSEFRDLPETINDAQYLIPRLTRDQRRETIVNPVQVAGVTITPRLIQRLLNDVGDNPDQLPILQHALMRTWNRWSAQSAPNEPLDIPHYEAVGRMASALSQHADEIFGGLDGHRLRRIAQRLFKALTDRGEDGRGVRRATRLDRLAASVEAEVKETESVVEAFRRPGCSFLMPPAGTPLTLDTVVDISHESLMRVWVQLRDWVDQETESARTYQRLAETAVLYRQKRARLWSNPDLSQALDWKERERPNAAWAQRYSPEFTAAMEFLDVSDLTERQARRRKRALALGVLSFTAGTAVAMFLLWAQAKTSLNQVQAFVDVNNLERLWNECPLLFAPETLSDEQLSEAARERCTNELRVVPQLLARLEGHRKTLERLEKDKDSRGGFQHSTVSRLVEYLEDFAGSPFLRSGKDRIKAMNALAGAVQKAREIASKKAACALLFSPGDAQFTNIESEAALCRESIKDLAVQLQSLEGERLKYIQDVRSNLGKLEHVVLDDLLEGLELLRAFIMAPDLDLTIGRVVAAADPEAWRRVIEAIAVNPRYQGLTLEPQVGLDPLGENPDSHLWEFAHILSGEAPRRSADGRLMISAETGVVLVLIPGGGFSMGSNFDYNERPVHAVRVPPFFLAKHELTQRQLFRLTGENPIFQKGDLPKAKSWSVNDARLPINSLSFNDGRLVATSFGLRLPTEAEWEYACRAGTTTSFSFGDDKSKLDEYAWYKDNSERRTHPVGTKKPNPWGLYDMHGNVWEWVGDEWHYTYRGAPTDGSAWVDKKRGAARVIRGGSWGRDASYCRSAYRDRDRPGYRYDYLGFRLSRSVTFGP